MSLACRRAPFASRVTAGLDDTLTVAVADRHGDGEGVPGHSIELYPCFAVGFTADDWASGARASAIVCTYPLALAPVSRTTGIQTRRCSA